MKKSFRCLIALSALLILSPSATRSAEEQSASTGARMAREDAVLVTVTASVESIDPANREVTLKGPLGNSVTFIVDKRVKRLEEIKVGDHVRADYYVAFAAELRKPTPEEEKVPFAMLDATGKAPPGTSPATGGLRRFKVVTTVEGLDRPTKTITLKGPRGKYLTTRVADPSRLSEMRIGENIVVTYTEALAISLEKAPKKNVD